MKNSFLVSNSVRFMLMWYWFMLIFLSDIGCFSNSENYIAFLAVIFKIQYIFVGY